MLNRSCLVLLILLPAICLMSLPVNAAHAGEGGHAASAAGESAGGNGGSSTDAPASATADHAAGGTTGDPARDSSPVNAGTPSSMAGDPVTNAGTGFWSASQPGEVSGTGSGIQAGAGTLSSGTGESGAAENPGNDQADNPGQGAVNGPADRQAQGTADDQADNPAQGAGNGQADGAGSDSPDSSDAGSSAAGARGDPGNAGTSTFTSAQGGPGNAGTVPPDAGGNGYGGGNEGAGSTGNEDSRGSSQAGNGPAGPAGPAESGTGPMKGSTGYQAGQASAGPGGSAGDAGKKGYTEAGQVRGHDGEPGIQPGAGAARGSTVQSFALAGATGAGITRAGYGSGSVRLPPGQSGAGPYPQHRQQGPPAQAGAYPCAPAQTTPLPPVSGEGQKESSEEGSPRNRSRRTVNPCPEIVISPIQPPAADHSAPSLFPYSLLLFGGYRRISKKNVLVHNARQVIHDTITLWPGIDTRSLTEATRINENTLRYHLAQLLATGVIVTFDRPGIVRYFRNQGAYTACERLLLHYLWTSTPRAILWLLYTRPGLTRQQIADTLGISGPSVTRQMEHLVHDRIVENRLPGRSNHYYLTAEAATSLSRLLVHAPLTVHQGTGPTPPPVPAG